LAPAPLEAGAEPFDQKELRAMAESIAIAAEARDRAGKGAARAARRAGMVPGVIYGEKQEPLLLNVDSRKLQLMLRDGGFFTRLYDVELAGGRHRVLARDVQFDPVTDRPVHIDFLRVGVGTTITVEVPVHFHSEAASPGLKRGGVLNVVRHTIEVVCRADGIPARLEVDLTGWDIGDSIHISNVALPEGVRPTITDRDFTVATIAAPSAVRAEATEAAQAAAAAAATAEEEPPEPEEKPPARGG
jgi:large subunit ribosomal protein L25